MNNPLTNNDLPGVSSKTNEIEVALNKVDNHSFPYNLSIYWLLAEGPCVARGQKICNFFSPQHPSATHECPQKNSAPSVQPFSWLKQHLHECLVLLYRFVFPIKE